MVAYERLTEARKVEPPMDCWGWNADARAQVKYGRNISSSSLKRGAGCWRERGAAARLSWRLPVVCVVRVLDLSVEYVDVVSVCSVCV